MSVRVAAICLLALLLSTLPAPAATGGSIVGKITLRSKVPRLHHSADPSGSVQDNLPSEDEMSNVVVFVEPKGAESYPPPTASVSMDQRRETFIPHVLPVLVGTVVDFYNHDPFYHNVFSLSPIKRFDLGRYPKGQRRSVNFGLLGSIRFDQPGVIQVFCEIHSHMNAFILVLKTPYFTTPQASGRFAIEGIPPGPATVHVWHDRLGKHTASVMVEPGHAVTCDLTL